jgi:hypothetical protein
MFVVLLSQPIPIDCVIYDDAIERVICDDDLVLVPTNLKH